jgi:hypothetical protein
MIASPTIGVDYVTGKFRAAEDESDARCFAVRQRRRQTNELAETATKLRWSALSEDCRFPT